MSSAIKDRAQRLRDLHLKRQEARQLNHAQVVEEDRRNKEPKNMDARRKRANYILEEEKMR
jgi:pre-mRNA-splicing factor SYF2